MAFSRAEESDTGLIVPALTFAEGDHTDALGNKRSHSQTSIRKYAKNSNTWLDSGEEIPLFDSSHDFEPGGYSNKNKVGLAGRFSSAIITEESLPKPEFNDLVGKLGLYTNIELRRPDAIALYKQKLIKPISIGLFSLGHGPQVAEISIVPWGAVRGAMLFSHPASLFEDEWEEDDEDEGDDSGIPEKKIFALTLDGAIAEREKRVGGDSYELEQLTETFARVISSIKNTTDAELLGRDRQTLISQAVDDLSQQLRQKLNVPALTDVTLLSKELRRSLNGLINKSVDGGNTREQAISLMAKASGSREADVETLLSEEDSAIAADKFQAFAAALFTLKQEPEVTVEDDKKPKNAPEDTPDLSARFSALEGRLNDTESRAKAAESELAQYKLRQEVGDRFLRLKQKAAELNKAGKFSRAAYLEYFPEAEQLSDAVAKFSRVASGETPEGEEPAEVVSLDEIEAALKYAEKFGQSVPVGSVSGDDPLPSHPLSSKAQAEEEEDMARFARKRA